MTTKQYGIRHISAPHAMIKLVCAPPRLCEWTDQIDECQAFEFESEATQAAKYITDYAFNVTAFQLPTVVDIVDKL